MQEQKRPFAVFDIDGTLIRWQLYHAIADALVKLDYVDREAFKTVKDARKDWKRRISDEAFRDYEQQLVQLYTSIIKDLPFEQLEQAAHNVFEEYKDQVYTYTRNLLIELKAKNYLLFAISGSQIEVVGLLAAYYGFDDCLGSVYERGKSGFTGKVTTYRTDKHIHVAELVKKYNATYENSIAVGDSWGDITMLEAVEKPIAFNPEKRLFQSAKASGWPIVVERKNMIYRLEPQSGQYLLAETDG